MFYKIFLCIHRYIFFLYKIKVQRKKKTQLFCIREQSVRFSCLKQIQGIATSDFTCETKETE